MEVIENAERTLMQVRRGSDTLVVIFNSYIFEPGKYEFYKTAMARRFDVIWVSDLVGQWFLHGATGLEGDAEALRDWLAEQAKPYRRVVCIGNSAGATASLMFGAELGAELTFNAAPQSRMRVAESLTCELAFGVWKPTFDELEALCEREPDGVVARRIDLKAHVASLPHHGATHLIVIPDSDIRDRFEGWRLGDLPGVRVFVSERDIHPGIQRLIEAGIVEDLFDLFDRPQPLGRAARRLIGRYLPEYLVPEPSWRRAWRQARLALRRRRERARDPSRARVAGGRRKDPRDI